MNRRSSMKKTLIFFMLLPFMAFLGSCSSNTIEPTDNLNYCTTSGSSKLIVCNSSSYGKKKVTIPETVEINGEVREIDGIANDAFKDNPYIESIVIPKHITRVGIRSFLNCSALKEVVFEGEGLTYLSSSMFENTPQLKTMKLPSRLETINSSCFKNCGLETLDFPSTLKEIKTRTFENAKLKSVTLDGVIIEEHAFTNCESLEEATIKNLDSIPYHAFYHPIALKKLTMSNVKEIGSYAFYGADSLESLSFDQNLEVINDSAFYGVNSLTSLTFQEGIKRIGVHTFESAKIETLTIPKGTVEIQGYAFNNSTLKEVFITEETIYNSKSFPDYTKITLH